MRKNEEQIDIPLINREFHDINPIVCGWQNCSNGHEFGPAIREYYLIHYILNGKGIFERQGDRYNLVKGGMFLIRPHESTFYKADYDNPWSYVWIGFNGAIVEELISGSHFNKSPVVYSPGCSFIFNNMTAASKKSQAIELYLCGMIFELFARLKEESKSDTRPAQIYARRAENYIQANYMYDINIAGIARMLGIDRRYLYRIYKEYTGTSPQNYLIKFRLAKAAELLSNYDCTVSEAARSCGYKDAFNFSNMFKKEYGISPSEYKKNCGLTKYKQVY